jgi:hypothetical protein
LVLLYGKQTILGAEHGITVELTLNDDGSTNSAITRE